MHIPVLESERLTIRPLALEDVDACHRLYSEIGWNHPAESDATHRARRARWVEWSVLNYTQLAQLQQPPYGERAVIDKTGTFVGLVGLVPLLAPFAQLPALGAATHARYSAEVGLFWAVSPAAQRRGYATEAARTLIAYAFGELQLSRILAGTDRDNLASAAVMRRLGMRVEHNPQPEPSWFQLVGMLEYDAADRASVVRSRH
jgi:RimJ/RimL family protein N-acetyltransferase